MGNVPELCRVRYYDTYLRPSWKLLGRLVEVAKVWDQLPSYERHGNLEWFRSLRMNLDHLRAGRERGELTRRQERELRQLERVAKDALGTIKILRERDAELYRREEGTR